MPKDRDKGRRSGCWGSRSWNAFLGGLSTHLWSGDALQEVVDEVVGSLCRLVFLDRIFYRFPFVLCWTVVALGSLLVVFPCSGRPDVGEVEASRSRGALVLTKVWRIDRTLALGRLRDVVRGRGLLCGPISARVGTRTNTAISRVRCGGRSHRGKGVVERGRTLVLNVDLAFVCHLSHGASMLFFENALLQTILSGLFRHGTYGSIGELIAVQGGQRRSREATIGNTSMQIIISLVPQIEIQSAETILVSFLCNATGPPRHTVRESFKDTLLELLRIFLGETRAINSLVEAASLGEYRCENLCEAGDDAGADGVCLLCLRWAA